MKNIFFVLLLALSVPAFANTAGYEPVPFQKMEPASIELLNAFVKLPKEVSEFMSYGNRVVEAEYLNMTPDYTRFKVTIQHCTRELGCLGGATLMIRKMKDPRPVPVAGIIYDAKILRLR